ncbi:site-2 protease family protein [Patescibacteria group bacterium]|nr:site-2 protease family protein [Patescibacteria group bacterium]MBU1448904.1 site-2 protease family protein [Patescibacteria group bacterium]MBU2612988.1 site-2 protease family protein [Patescibacteria group bacterium]
MTILAFFIILSVLVLIHELGHFAAARFFKVKAEEFGYGFPPRLIGFVREKGRWKRVGPKDRGTYRNTIWSLNWLPIGGFVRIKGEQAGDADDSDSFHAKAIWKRVIIIAAGVTMNWVLAFVLFVAVFMAGTDAVLEDLPAGAHISGASVRVTQVLRGAPAEIAGIETNDVVLEVDGIAPATWDAARDLIGERRGTTFPIRVQRDGVEKDVTVTPAFVASLDRVAIGVGLADVGHVSFGPLNAMKASAAVVVGYTKATVLAFWELGRDLVVRRTVSQDVSGPVGIAVMTGQFAEQGFVALLQFAGILSINLAVINFLPIPALDGGRVVFLVVEKLRRKPMSRHLEAAIHNIAFLILIGLILLITVRDLAVYGGRIVLGLRNAVGM